MNDTKLKAKDRKGELIKSFEVIKELFSEQNKLLIETNNKYKQNQNNDEIEANRKLFSDAIKTQPKDNEIKTKELIIVYPKDKNVSSEELKSKLKSKIVLTTVGKIGINNVRKIRNNGINIECNSKNDCLKLEQNLNNDYKHLC